ncbi:MAG TPA: high frequency lysogenization protein HflD [Arenimonas sp.]|uniref:high frequency lysogenization protein HflD n=1 Tax=Arenimonas sp. TaxID=1872635 RepID=UPI002C256E28|nr:high frequency lysogenization protein HflD [Arenimonas sp.]HMB55816.1 high frequency lysogenization protein HflD [Arenimonas sp.]
MKDRVIALAALLQAIKLVQQMANNGQAETQPLAACIDSLFRFDADSAEAVYGNPRELDSGLRRLIAQLDGGDRDTAQTRMAMNVLSLERRFIGNDAAVAAVQKTLADIQRQREDLGPTHPTILSRLGELYAAQISPLGARVLVQGNPVYLGQPDVVGEVRASLLAALRAAVLWRQVGGSYWDFLLSRRAMTQTARELLG